MSARPTFGTAPSGVPCEDRRAAYAVILDPDGHVAAVRSGAGLFLPGGGSLSTETPESTVLREIHEECGRAARIILPLGEAIQYFSDKRRFYRMVASFFMATFDGDPDGPGEHELTWLRPDETDQLFHKCHEWAVARGRASTPNDPGAA